MILRDVEDEEAVGIAYATIHGQEADRHLNAIFYGSNHGKS
jgi:hypothetical protein